jgi:DNA-directed RNA polymerase subunit RPC12/RpoP
MARPVPRFPRQKQAPYRKAVLFCPDCGHESLVNGDWRVQRRDADQDGTEIVYQCTECDGEIVTLPEGGFEDPGRSRRSAFGPTGVGVWSHVWLSYARLVSEWLQPGRLRDEESLS